MQRDLLDTSGKRLRALRVNAGLKQSELAEQLGITQSHLSRIERDKSPVNPVVAEAARIFGVSTDYLLLRMDTPRMEGVVEADEDDSPSANMRLLQMMVREVAEERQSQLLRYLIRQVNIYNDLFPEK